MEKFLFILGIMFIVTVFAWVIFFGCTSQGQEIWKQYQLSVHHITDTITDEQRNEVETKCREMISAWESEVKLYEQFKDSDTADAKVITDHAKEVANKIAQGYNQYMQTNSYVFAGNLPSDIYAAIEPIE